MPAPSRLLTLLLALATTPLSSFAQDEAAPPAEPGAGQDGGSAQGEPAQVRELLAQADAAYKVRDEPGKLEEVADALVKAEKLAPDDYGVLWRLSRYYFWVADDPSLSNDEKSQLGKKGWEFGDRATRADPNRVEGWFFAAAGVGNYALGIGVLKALSQGIEGKFRERLDKAQKIDPGFLDGAIENAWGRFFFKLPWPKYNADEAKRHLRLAMRLNPSNVRARVYLAEVYLKENHPRDARKLLEDVMAQPIGQYDPPEERRYQSRARILLSSLPP